jgi:hypothetical protein
VAALQQPLRCLFCRRHAAAKVVHNSSYFADCRLYAPVKLIANQGVSRLQHENEQRMHPMRLFVWQFMTSQATLP